MKKVILQREPIDTAVILGSIGTPADGAILTFTGTARNNSMDKRVEYLDYDAYEGMALREMERIADDAVKQWALSDCIIIHRRGRVGVGEASVFIAVSSPHRDEGFASLRYIIDTIKKTVPIWKKEFYSDGSSWVSPNP